MFLTRYELFGLIAIISVAMAAAILTWPAPMQSDAVIFQTATGNVTVSVEVAQTYDQLATGLMNRASLPQNSGMLFVFGQPRILSFWMKNTLIPLDMVFVSSDLKVVKIERNVQPCRTSSCTSYGGVLGLYVVEVNAGFCDNHGIKEGDSILISLK